MSLLTKKWIIPITSPQMEMPEIINNINGQRDVTYGSEAVKK